MAEVEFKPCPFCAGTNLVCYGDLVECLDCGTQGPSADHWAEAAALWNNRRSTQHPEQ